MAGNRYITSFSKKSVVELSNKEEFDRLVKHLSQYNNVAAAIGSGSLSSKAILIHDPNGIRIDIYHI
jgi:catechol-2,3-dioxygenase